MSCESTASQTAWALLGLVAAGEAASEAAGRAAAWLADPRTDWVSGAVLTVDGANIRAVTRFHLDKMYPLFGLPLALSDRTGMSR